MKTKIIKAISICTFAYLHIFTLSSCEQDANIDVPYAEPKLVVSSFISSDDDSIMITVSKSDPIFDGGTVQNRYVSDATVTISDGTTTKTLVHRPNIGNPQNSYYYIHSSEFPIEKGKTYYVNVSTPGGLTASTQCTVNSNAIPIDSLHVDSIIRDHDEMGEVEYFVSIHWTDRGGEKNYYRIFAQAKMVSPSGDTVYQDAYSGLNDYDLSDDKNKDGQKMSGRLTYSTFSSFGPFPEYYYKIVGFEVYLLNIDEDYYNYYKSIENYNDASNPFVEPSLVYTNVENGFGIFCSYHKSKKEAKL